MNEKSYVLAIDNGTQSVRALLFDLEGNLLGKGKVELEAYYSTQPGWAEQDPEDWWRAACAALAGRAVGPAGLPSYSRHLPARLPAMRRGETCIG